MATYAIGDVQGCYQELMALLDKIAFSGNDQLWFCGDLVNRGPQSLETLRFIRSLGSQAVCVLGNHDLHLLAVHHGAVSGKKKDTLNGILCAPDRQELMHWLQQQPLLHTDPQLNFTLVHAGIPPCWSLKTAQQLAKEVEYILTSPQARDFFSNMYGNQPVRWTRQLEGWERLRVITNYFTRMRFCMADSALEFTAKGGLETQPEGFLPWFAHPQRKTRNERILFGHWAALSGKVEQENLFALDTGCIWGLELTALKLEDQTRISVPSQQPALR